MSDPSEFSVPESAQFRNGLVFMIATSLTYLIVPVTYVGVLHATILDSLQASDTVALRGDLRSALTGGKTGLCPALSVVARQDHKWDFREEIPYEGDAKSDRQAEQREGFTELDFNFRPDGSVICLIRTSDGNGHGPLCLTRSVDGARTQAKPMAFDLTFDSGKMPQLLTLEGGATLAS